jgi:hypothetical protein
MMDCAHLPAIHPHSKLWGILAFSREAAASYQKGVRARQLAGGEVSSSDQ